MQLTDLPLPGMLTRSMALRKEVVGSINAVQLYPNPDTRESLHAFFLAAAEAIAPEAPAKQPKARKAAE